MRIGYSVLSLVVLAGFLPSLAWIGPAGAQTARPAASQTLAQAERTSVDLKQGMTLEEVQKLLGKPRRTSLKGNLQWTYIWTSASASPASLQIDFVSKTPEQWYVNSWEWGTY